MSQSNKASGGIGFPGLLALLFIALKLTGVIDWTWLWVLSPIWIPFIMIAIVFSVIGLMALINLIRRKNKGRR